MLKTMYSIFSFYFKIKHCFVFFFFVQKKKEILIKYLKCMSIYARPLYIHCIVESLFSYKQIQTGNEEISKHENSKRKTHNI